MKNRDVQQARWLRCGAAMIVFSALCAGCQRGNEKSDQPDKGAAAEATVEEVLPKMASLPHIVEQPGAIQAYEETQLYARVSGYVRLPRDPEGGIYFDIGRKIHGPKSDTEGAETKPGDVLAEVVVPELADDVKQKKALTRQAEAEVEQARKTLASAEANISIMEASIVEAKAMQERWESESKRLAALVKTGAVDAQARDETQNQFKAAGARVTSAEAAVRKAKADRDKAQSDVQATQAKVDVAKAEAGRSATMLAYAKIQAPYDGIVVMRHVNTGDFVQPTGGKGDWLFTVARVDPVRVVITVPEADAGLIQIDKADVNLNVPALVGTELTGPYKIRRTSWALETGARTLRTEIDLPNKDGRLRPGMYVYGKISNPRPACWTLPVSAVVKHGDTMDCFQIDQAGKVVRKTVQVGKSDGNRIEVLRMQRPGAASSWENFLGEGTFAAPARGLKDGQTVQIKKSSK